MAIKIRLTRKGKKNFPIYNIVVADVRAPRDGRFIKKLGVFNPHNSDIKQQVQIDQEETFKYLMYGAQPTQTVKSILSKEGLMYKLHLKKGVIKGAITQKQADTNFEKWQKSNEAKIDKLQKSILSKQKKTIESNINQVQLNKEAKVKQDTNTTKDTKSEKVKLQEETKPTEEKNQKQNEEIKTSVNQKTSSKEEEKNTMQPKDNVLLEKESKKTESKTEAKSEKKINIKPEKQSEQSKNITTNDNSETKSKEKQITGQNPEVEKKK